MTGRRRDKSPNRPRTDRTARVGMVALLTLGAGAGCTQSLTRPPTGPSPSPQSAAATEPAAPDRPGALADRQAAARAQTGSAGALLRPVSVPKVVTEVPGYTAPDGRVYPLEGPDAMTPDPRYQAWLTPGKTWNGWKIPASPRPAAADVIAAGTPVPGSPPAPVGPNVGERQALLDASSRLGIAPPTDGPAPPTLADADRPAPAPSTPAAELPPPAEPLADSAPAEAPAVASAPVPAATVGAPEPQPVAAPAPVPAAVAEVPPPAVEPSPVPTPAEPAAIPFPVEPALTLAPETSAPAPVEPKVDPTTLPAASPVPEPVSVPDPIPVPAPASPTAPEAAPPAGLDLPSPAEALPVPAPTPAELPSPVEPVTVPSPSPSPVAPEPILVPHPLPTAPAESRTPAPSGDLLEASGASGIPLPNTTAPSAPLEAPPSLDDPIALPNDPGALNLPPATTPAPVPAPKPAGDPLRAAARSTSIPLPKRPGAGPDPLVEASLKTDIPLPTPR